MQNNVGEVVPVLRWIDAWCFFCQRHFFRPGSKVAVTFQDGDVVTGVTMEHAFTCSECEKATTK